MGKLHADDTGLPLDRGRAFNKDLYEHLLRSHGCLFSTLDLRGKTHAEAWKMFMKIHRANHVPTPASPSSSEG